MGLGGNFRQLSSHAIRIHARLRLFAVSLGALVAFSGAYALFAAHRAPISSDESLYLSEAINIARGVGPSYTTHDLIQHRPFLFPAMLALPMSATGGFGGVYWLTRCIVLFDAAVLACLAWRLFGTRYALPCAAVALSSRFLTGFGVTVFLDSTETLFLLLSILAWWEASARSSWRLGGCAGLALALAFLTKEAALLWLPLPLLAVMLEGRTAMRGALRPLAACYVAFAGSAGWWWAYVWAIDRRLYMWPASPLVAVFAAATGIAVAALLVQAVLVVERRSTRGANALLRGAGLVLAASWVGAFTVVMELTSWPFPKDFAATIPAYFHDVVAGNLAPWPLTAAAACMLFSRAPADRRYRLLALGFVLWMPFAVFAANRGFALRDLLPMVYLVYLISTVLLVDLGSWLIDAADGIPNALLLAAVLMLAAGYFETQNAATIRDHHSTAMQSTGDWNNELVRDTASWFEANVPAGASIMSSRLYFSQLYVLTNARYRIAQIPTVNVVPTPGRSPYLRSRSTLFRWEDDLMRPPGAPNDWISVDRYTEKGYYTALSQQDLLNELARRRANYLVLTGEDVAFSTTRYVDYFETNRAFTLLHHANRDGEGEVYVFRIDRDRLALQPYRTTVAASVVERLYESARETLTASDFVRAVNPQGMQVQHDADLDPALAIAIAQATGQTPAN